MDRRACLAIRGNPYLRIGGKFPGAPFFRSFFKKRIARFAKKTAKKRSEKESHLFMRGTAPQKSRIDLPSRRVFEYNKIGRKKSQKSRLTEYNKILWCPSPGQPRPTEYMISGGYLAFRCFFYKTGPRASRSWSCYSVLE